MIKRASQALLKKGIATGETVIFIGDERFKATVCGDKDVVFEGQTYKLSTLAKILYTKIGKVTKSGAYQGGRHFKYKGVLVIDLPDIK